MSDIEKNEVEEVLENTEALQEEGAASNQASIDAKPTISRSDLMSKMVAYASKLDKDSLAQAVETLTKSNDEIYASTQQTTGDASAKNKASIKSSGAPADSMQSVKEDLAVLFGEDETLSEDFRIKTEALFEAAVSARVDLERVKIEEAFEAKLEEEVEAVAESMVENVDSYINYAVAEWIAENKLAIESNIRTEIAESLLSGIKNLLGEHNIVIPEDQVDVVESMAEKIEELEAKLNESNEVIDSLKKTVNEKEVNEIVSSMTESLSDVQKEKFTKLVEAVNFADAEEFRKKASIIKETYFSAKSEVKATPDSMLTESVEEPEAAPAIAPDMQMYVQSLSRSIKK